MHWYGTTTMNDTHGSARVVAYSTEEGLEYLYRP